MDVDKNWVFITGNGDIKKVPNCNVKLSIKTDNDDNDVVEVIEKEDSTKNKDRNGNLGHFGLVNRGGGHKTFKDRKGEG